MTSELRVALEKETEREAARLEEDAPHPPHQQRRNNGEGEIDRKN